jgi:hypothetical protein
MSASVKWVPAPAQKAFSPRPRLMACRAEFTRTIWRSIQAWLRSPSARPAQVCSRRAAMLASSRPSARASQVRTSARSRPVAGISLPTGESMSTYSTITRESNTASPPSITRQGTLPSGLEARMSSRAQTSSSTNW